MTVDRTWLSAKELPHYEHSQSFDPLDALSLPLLFHGSGPWDDQKKAEWFRITGTREATTKAMCDHIRRTLATLGWVK